MSKKQYGNNLTLNSHRNNTSKSCHRSSSEMALWELYDWQNLTLFILLWSFHHHLNQPPKSVICVFTWLQDDLYLSVGFIGWSLKLIFQYDLLGDNIFKVIIIRWSHMGDTLACMKNDPDRERYREERPWEDTRQVCPFKSPEDKPLRRLTQLTPWSQPPKQSKT